MEGTFLTKSLTTGLWGTDDLVGNMFVAAEYIGGLGRYWAIVVDSVSIPVAIDIKPGSDPNSINLRSRGVIPVAILTTNTAHGDAANFYALDVDPLSVMFGPDGAGEARGRGHVEDVDDDGDMDLVLRFRTQETGIQCGDAQATLTGETWDKISVEGSDAIQTVGCAQNGSRVRGGPCGPPLP